MAQTSLSARLTEAMQDAHVESGAHLARMVGVSDVTIGNWLNDRVQPEQVKAALLLRIADVLRIRPQWLLFGEGEKAAPITVGHAVLGPSQSVKQDLLTLALQLATEAEEYRGRPLPAHKKSELASNIYGLLEDGVSEAKVVSFAKLAAA